MLAEILSVPVENKKKKGYSIQRLDEANNNDVISQSRMIG
jgi:biotin operon repressor